jgi:hypothetical protein
MYIQSLSREGSLLYIQLLKESIIFLKNGWKKNCRKNYQNYLKSTKYDVCTAAALSSRNVLDIMTLENM